MPARECQKWADLATFLNSAWGGQNQPAIGTNVVTHRGRGPPSRRPAATGSSPDRIRGRALHGGPRAISRRGNIPFERLGRRFWNRPPWWASLREMGASFLRGHPTSRRGGGGRDGTLCRRGSVGHPAPSPGFPHGTWQAAGLNGPGLCVGRRSRLHCAGELFEKPLSCTSGAHAVGVPRSASRSQTAAFIRGVPPPLTGAPFHGSRCWAGSAPLVPGGLAARGETPRPSGLAPRWIGAYEGHWRFQTARPSAARTSNAVFS